MGDSQKLRQVVERVVSETLQAHLSALKSEIVENACRELEPLFASSGASAPSSAPAASGEAVPAGGMPTDLLNAAFTTVMDSNSQTDILLSLLEGSAKFAQRSALFVLKGGSAVGWRARGFGNDDAIKSVHFDPNTGLAGRAYSDRQSAQAAAAEFDPGFISTFGEPLVGTNAIVLPLLLHQKVAALVYADGGAIGKMDPSALECLTRGASLWLEIVAARKSGAPVPEPVPEPESTGTQKIPAMKEAPEPPAPVQAAPPPPQPVTAPPQAAAAAAPAPVAGSPDDGEVHKKAKRFAKLLVDEIKLYNKQKVADGIAHKDLYRRLKDDIDKSRSSYEKRYGQTAAGSAKYFDQELVRVLCDGDASLLGA
ncbi:MAG: hypothetical protein ACRD3E_16480 [Terriglobales bacterium]